MPNQTNRSTDLNQNKNGTISFQGKMGAYSHLACCAMFPHMQPLACKTFENALTRVQDGSVDLTMIPIENSSAGRVADIHHLLPHSGLFIVGEHYEPVKHCLLAIPGAKLEKIRDVYCHVHTIGQVRNFVHHHNLNLHIFGDNAGAAEWVASQNTPDKAAIASQLAAELYNLKTLRENISDEQANTTRFVVLSKQEIIPDFDSACPTPAITSLFVETKSVPAALYKVLGGFATNSINITKLESYVTGEFFRAARFYIEVEGHPKSEALKQALEELDYFARFRILGTFAAAPFRYGAKESNLDENR